jgi:signal transduction histidine kinase
VETQDGREVAAGRAESPGTVASTATAGPGGRGPTGPRRGRPPWIDGDPERGRGPWAYRSDRRRRRGSVVLAVFVLVVELVGVHTVQRHQGAVRPIDAGGNALLIAGAAALAFRVRWRIPAYAVSLAATVAYVVAGYPYGPVFLAVLVSIFGAVRTGHRRGVWITTAAGYVVFVCAGRVFGSIGGVSLRTPSVGTSILVAAWIAVVLVLAEGVRVRTERFAEMARMQAEQARARAEQKRRQDSEERLRIARELHDVLGHHLSLINVQAGVGLHLMDEHPGQARAALEAIKEASATALGEVRSVLGVLRTSDEAAPRSPAPTLANLDGLIDAADTVVIGTPRTLPPEVDRAAYRIVQESLTNVRRHAGDGAHASVTLTYQPDALVVRVADDGTAQGAVEAGNGIAGMRARAVALGGSLAAARGPSGGFVVVATLPIRETS